MPLSSRSASASFGQSSALSVCRRPVAECDQGARAPTMPAEAQDASRPGRSRSSTTTARPAERSSRAISRPMMPPPTTTTSGIAGRLPELDDAARDLAGVQCPERLVDLGQLETARDQLAQLQAALHEQVDQLREVDVRPGRAVVAAEQPLAGPHQRRRRERDLLFLTRDADDHRGAALPDDVERLPDRRRGADHLEGVIGAPAAGQLLDRLDDVLAAGVDEVGRAELARELELLVEQVDR